ncbi:deoxyribodipyrimidine photo-lyase family protein [Rhodovulum sulfidophilum]|uniref:Deoxyribodipyrimidine photo-lyase family protein n=2 Tax=Rhodovulum sulfidophilum TaxID=35806 RepID=A0A0D6B1F2_RHOSU|nr:deoxyribodipyrimidine photo-lyase family protein [Rhodovulum sulfidophilum]
MGVTILSFGRDLRVEDHPALARAGQEAGAEGGAVLPVFIVDPAVWSAPEASARQWRVVAEGLASLSAALAARGAALQVEIGPPAEVLDRLAARWPVSRGLALGAQPPSEAWARRRGLPWRPVAAPRRPAPPLGELTAPPGLEPGPIPEARDLGLGFDPCPGRPRGGRSEAERALAAALAGGDPDAALSAHLAWGALSAGEAARSPRLAPEEAGARRLASWLARRARFQRIPAADPAPVAAPPDPGADARLAAWARGETGLPAVDAAMRALIHDGMLDAGRRGLLAAVGCGQLGLDPGACCRVLARLSADYDPRLHGVQFRAAAARRVDPLRWARAADPEGVFLRRWLPELADLPPDALHAPWTCPAAARRLGRRYPHPLVAPGPGRPAGSRSASPAARRQDSRQLAFDL